MVRKGKLQEIFSKALYSDDDDDAERYSVFYRDFDSVVKISLPGFIKVSENFEIIPATRILKVEKDGIVLYSKTPSKIR
jgi:uncharacterized protein (UPF0248 family)